MRAILSGVHPKQGGQQSLELELIDVPYAVTDLAMIFMEKNALATFNVPIHRGVRNNMLKVRVDMRSFTFEHRGQSDFSWEMYFAFNVDHQPYLLQVESEFVSGRHQLTLDSYFEFNSDDEEHALLDVHTNQDVNDFSITSINLTQDGLTVTGHDTINGQRLGQQTLILKDQASGEQVEYADTVNLLHGLFAITIPVDQLSAGHFYDLRIEYHFQGRLVDQRVIWTRALAGQNDVQPQSNGQTVKIHATPTSGVVISALPPVRLTANVAALGGKVSQAEDKFRQLNMKVNNRYMRWLFKRGHKPFETTTIIFESFGGRQVSDSPLAIYQLFKKLYPGFQLIWSVDHSAVADCKANGIPYVVRRTAKWVRTLEKARGLVMRASQLG